MAKKKGLPLGTFLKWFSSEVQCQEHLASLRWRSGYVYLKCGCRHRNGCPTDDTSVPNLIWMSIPFVLAAATLALPCWNA